MLLYDADVKMASNRLRLAGWRVVVWFLEQLDGYTWSREPQCLAIIGTRNVKMLFVYEANTQISEHRCFQQL